MDKASFQPRIEIVDAEGQSILTLQNEEGQSKDGAGEGLSH